jgi:preprotein translocase subunit SecG
VERGGADDAVPRLAWAGFSCRSAQFRAGCFARRPLAVGGPPLAAPGSPMQTVLIVIHLIIVLALIAVVLLQRSEGGLGLGGGGSGTQGFLTGRGQANALTRATAILAALFFATSMVLAIMTHRTTAPRSIFEGAATPAQPGQPAAPPPGGNLLDQLRQQQDKAAPPASPAAPETPAAPQSR